MTDYIRGQRVRVKRNNHTTAPGTVTATAHRGEAAGIQVRFDAGGPAYWAYPSELEPLGAILTKPEEGDTVTINGVMHPVVVTGNLGDHIRVTPDLIVQWDALVALGFTLDERETTEEQGA